MLDSTIKIPDRLAKRPRDPRGYPIPYIQFIPADPNIRVDFRVTDPEKRTQCILDRTCGICGEPLEYWIYLIGGEETIKHRIFSDPPMHEECARFSIAACPFLANRNYRVSNQLPKHIPVQVDALQVAERPEKMGLYITRSYQPARVRTDGAIHPVLYCHPAPAKSIEWF